MDTLPLPSIVLFTCCIMSISLCACLYLFLSASVNLTRSLSLSLSQSLHTINLDDNSEVQQEEGVFYELRMHLKARPELLLLSSDATTELGILLFVDELRSFVKYEVLFLCLSP